MALHPGAVAEKCSGVESTHSSQAISDSKQRRSCVAWEGNADPPDKIVKLTEVMTDTVEHRADSLSARGYFQNRLRPQLGSSRRAAPRLLIPRATKTSFKKGGSRYGMVSESRQR